MKDFGQVAHYLGLEVVRDRAIKTIPDRPEDLPLGDSQ